MNTIPFPCPGAAGPRHMTSRYRGVTFNKKSFKWQAVINSGGKGTFSHEEDAAVAFDNAAIILRGLKAKLNFGIHDYIATDGSLLVDGCINNKVQMTLNPSQGDQALPGQQGVNSIVGRSRPRRTWAPLPGSLAPGVVAGLPAGAQDAGEADAPDGQANRESGQSQGQDSPCGDEDENSASGNSNAGTDDEKTHGTAQHGMAGQGADDDKTHSPPGGANQTDFAGNPGKIQALQHLPSSGPSNDTYLSRPGPSACLHLSASEQGARAPGPLPGLNGILHAARGAQPPQRPMHKIDSYMPPRSDQRSNLPNNPMHQLVAEPLKLQPPIKLPGLDFGIRHPHGAPSGAGSESSQGRLAGDLPPAATHHSDSETAMWDMITQLERKLPPGAVLDCVVPDSNARVLGLLYREKETSDYRSRGGSNMCAAIWQQNDLLGRMSSRSSVEARNSLDNMMEFAASFRRSEKRPLDHYQGQPQGVQHKPAFRSMERPSSLMPVQMAMGPQQSQMMEVPSGRERDGPHLVPVNPSDVRDYPGGRSTSSAFLHPMAMPEMAIQYHPTGPDMSGVRNKEAPFEGTVPRFVPLSHGEYSIKYQQQHGSQLGFGAHSSAHMQQPTQQLQVASHPHQMLRFASDPRGNQGDYIMQVPNSAPQQQILYNHNLVSIPLSALPNHMYSSPMQHYNPAGQGAPEKSGDDNVPQSGQGLIVPKRESGGAPSAAAALQQMSRGFSPSPYRTTQDYTPRSGAP
eukprot:gene26784-4370_t